MDIAAYCRVSTHKEEQLDSLIHQKAFFNEYAVRNSLNLVRLYADEGISGKQIKKRDEFLRMMSDAKKGLFDMVVVKDISRFARNTVDFLSSIRQLKLLGVGVQFLSNNQTSLGDSEFILTIFSALAQEESANLSKRVKFGKNLNAVKGKVPNQVFGYDQVDKFTLTVNEEEAEIVRTIFKMYVEEGLGAQKIAEWLKRNTNIKPKRNGTWGQNGIARILRNELYTGVVITKKSEVIDFISGKRKDIDQSKQIRTERPDLAIISNELYEGAQKARFDRQDLFKINKERYSNHFVFSTLIKCGHCGTSFRRFYKDFKYSSYQVWTCNGKYHHGCDNKAIVREQELLSQIIDYLKSVVSDKDDFLRAALSEYKEDTQQSQIPLERKVDKEKLQNDLTKLERSKTKLMEMYQNEVITMEELKTKTSKINSEILSLKEKLEFKADIENKQEYLERKAEVTLRKSFDTMEEIISAEHITNDLLKQVIEKIVVDRTGEVKIHIRQFES